MKINFLLSLHFVLMVQYYFNYSVMKLPDTFFSFKMLIDLKPPTCRHDDASLTVVF
jgi:hypothetical protein